MVALCEFSPLHLLYIMICLCVSEALRRGLQRQCIQIIMVSTRQLSLFPAISRRSRGTIHRGILGKCFWGFLYWCNGCIPQLLPPHTLQYASFPGQDFTSCQEEEWYLQQGRCHSVYGKAQKDPVKCAGHAFSV